MSVQDRNGAVVGQRWIPDSCRYILSTGWWKAPNAKPGIQTRRRGLALVERLAICDVVPNPPHSRYPGPVPLSGSDPAESGGRDGARVLRSSRHRANRPREMTPCGGRFPDLRLGFGDPGWQSLFLDDMYAGRDGFASDGPGHISAAVLVEKGIFGVLPARHLSHWYWHRHWHQHSETP